MPLSDKERKKRKKDGARKYREKNRESLAKKSKERREKNSKGKKKGEVWNKGKKLSDEHKRKLSKTWFKKGQAIRKGAKHTEESKQKMSKSKKKLFASGYVHPMQGTEQSEESKQNHSKFMKKLYADNLIVSPMKGKKHLPASRKKIIEKRLHQVFPQKDAKSTEIPLQKQLKENNIKFEKHKPILGQPDIFIKPNICIFTDGDFWHANPNQWLKHGVKQKGFKLNDHVIGKKTAKDVWDYDQKITDTLKKDGYVILRFWETELETSPKKCLQKIIKAIKKSKGKRT